MNLFKILTVLETEVCGPIDEDIDISVGSNNLKADPTHMDADLLDNGDQPYPWQGMCIGVVLVLLMIFAMLLPWALGCIEMMKWMFN